MNAVGDSEHNGVVVGADVFRLGLAGDGVVEHADTKTPSMHSRSTPKPMMRRVNTSITTSTQ